jgi:hypothetical protein
MDGLTRSLLAASVLGLLMTSCSAGSPLENLPPSMGGLPADAPAAPKLPYQFPAVHDMPPPRSAKPLSDDQQIKLEHDLEAARDRQIRKSGEDPDAASEPKKPAAVTKKKPTAAKKRSDAAAQAGAKTNP